LVILKSSFLQELILSSLVKVNIWNLVWWWNASTKVIRFEEVAIYLNLLLGIPILLTCSLADWLLFFVE
jgi:hypothetical protein